MRFRVRFGSDDDRCDGTDRPRRSPEAILFYRQQLQWLGGLGIIVLAVAVLPMLGVGGMQLYRAETPGPVKDTKLTPRITETAKALWYVYLGSRSSAGCVLGGRDEPFRCAVHSFSTVAIGGFSTHDASIGYFQSPLIEMIAVVFMFIAGVNFSLHFLAWRQLQLSNYLADPEFGAYVKLLGGLTLFVLVYLYLPATTARCRRPSRRACSTLYRSRRRRDSLPIASCLARSAAGAADPVELRRRLRGVDGGGMKVDPMATDVQAGLARGQRLVHPSAAITVKLGDKAVHVASSTLFGVSSPSTSSCSVS